MNVMEMRAQRKTSRSISHANRIRDNTWVNSRGPLEQNLVETPATRIPPKIWRMVPRATRPKNGQSRYLKLAVAGVLCITLVLLVPRVAQKSHRALTLEYPTMEEMDDLVFAQKVRLLQTAKNNETTINEMVEFLLQKGNRQSAINEIREFHMENKLRSSSLLPYYFVLTEHRFVHVTVGGNKVELQKELRQKRRGKQFEKAMELLMEMLAPKDGSGSGTMIKVNERYLQNWQDALTFYKELQSTRQRFCCQTKR